MMKSVCSVLKFGVKGTRTLLWKPFRGAVSAVKQPNMDEHSRTEWHDHSMRDAEDEGIDARVAMSIDLNKVSIDFDGLSEKHQQEFITDFSPELTKILEQGKIESILFNNICESVYRYNISKEVSRDGYKGRFQRYNHDRGAAWFEQRDD